MFRAIRHCRICASPHLEPILSLGDQVLTGVFPSRPDRALTCGPLELVRCSGVAGAEALRSPGSSRPTPGELGLRGSPGVSPSHPTECCGLVQLAHTYEPGEMYGDAYGYRSGINASMVRHLESLVQGLLARLSLREGDVVLDIGSNDGTLLGFYPQPGPLPVGMDPAARRFARYYKPHVRAIPEFFSAAAFRRHVGARPARIITSIAMFYDLEDPQAFVNQVAQVLAPDGLWLLEQSYLPAMMEANAYDTICHEHAEYYALAQIDYLVRRAGMEVVGVSTNDTNGGSFAVTVAKPGAGFAADSAPIEAMARRERALGLDTPAPYARFKEHVFAHREQLRTLLTDLKRAGKTVLGYGASTKGNVVLQFCGIGPDLVPAIAEVNQDKFGCYTPGTGIPIISEDQARARKPDYLLVFPWHFRAGILAREADYLRQGGKLIFPLPRIEVCGP